MVRILFFCFFLGNILAAYSQTSIGIGNNNPNPKAVLDVMSNQPTTNPQGMLLPRLTSIQKNAMGLTGGDKGMIVFDTNINKIDAWNGIAWSSTLAGLIGSPTWDTLSSIGDATTNFNVGIGIVNPTQALEANGDIIIGGGAASSDGTSEFLQFKAESESWYMGPYNNANPNLSDFYISTTNGGDGTFHIEASSNFVGIGTTTPNTTLEVAGTISTDSLITKDLQIVSNPGQGKVLTSNATGNASWQKSITPIMLLNADFLSATPQINATTWPTPSDITLDAAGALTTISVAGINFTPATHFVQVTPNLNASLFSVVDFNGGDIEIRSYDETGSAFTSHLMIAIYEY